MKYIILAIALLCSFPAFATELPPSLYSYETSTGMKVGAVFGTLPKPAEDDELLSASSPICNHVEIHRMQDVKGIMQMRQVTGIPLKKNTENMLSASGYHLMLMGLSAPLQNGKEFPLTLTYKKAGQTKVSIPVISRKVK